MNYFLTAEQELIQQIARRFARERVAAMAAGLDERGEFPRHLLEVLAKTDLCGVYIPEEYGGLGGACLSSAWWWRRSAGSIRGWPSVMRPPD